jgi:hypothetical protein
MATAPEVRIDLTCAFPYRAGAQFLSAIAYPRPSAAEAARRIQFARALCRREVFTRAADDESYANAAQDIPPDIFEGDYDAFSDLDAVNEGLDNVTKRIVATAFVLVPYLGEPMSSNIKNLCEAGAVAYGWSASSRTNFIDEVWTDTKRVPHATLAWCGFDSTKPAQSLKCVVEQVRDSYGPETIKAGIKHRFCVEIDKFLKDHLSIRSVVELAEQLRPQLATIVRHGRHVFAADGLIKFQLYDYR